MGKDAKLNIKPAKRQEYRGNKDSYSPDAWVKDSFANIDISAG